jgi:hypothetical protein
MLGEVVSAIILLDGWIEELPGVFKRRRVESRKNVLCKNERPGAGRQVHCARLRRDKWTRRFPKQCCTIGLPSPSLAIPTTQGGRPGQSVTLRSMNTWILILG